jgi:hypothetical protein
LEAFGYDLLKFALIMAAYFLAAWGLFKIDLPGTAMFLFIPVLIYLIRTLPAPSYILTYLITAMFSLPSKEEIKENGKFSTIGASLFISIFLSAMIFGACYWIAGKITSPPSNTDQTFECFRYC